MIKTISENHVDMIALREAEGKLRALKKRLRETENQLQKKHDEYCTMMAKSAQERINEQAAQLLTDGGSIGSVTRGDLERLANDCLVVKSAIATQERTVSIAAGKVSRLTHELNRGAYVESARRIARLVEELAEANEFQAKLFDELRAVVREVRFRSTQFPAVGTASDTQSGAAFHRAELKKFVPEALAS